MTSSLGFLLLVTLVGAVAHRLQANHLRNSLGPREPGGSDSHADRDMIRLRHDLAVARRTGSVRPSVPDAAHAQPVCHARCVPSTS